jgi:hypothetical protein
MAKNNNELNILICGSQKFEDRKFVFGMLDEIYHSLPDLHKIITSKFSGACEFAREWTTFANDTLNAKIDIADFSFDSFLQEKNLSLYEQIEIPDFIVKQDPFFQRGKEQLQESQIKLVLAFPNKDGVLGASTLNIQRMANLAGINVFDCSSALAHITELREAESCAIVEPQDGLTNRHPARKL